MKQRNKSNKTTKQTPIKRNMQNEEVHTQHANKPTSTRHQQQNKSNNTTTQTQNKQKQTHSKIN